MVRRDKTERRNLNSEEMEAMGFTEMAIDRDDEGWPYPDNDDSDDTEKWWQRNGARDDDRHWRGVHE